MSEAGNINISKGAGRKIVSALIAVVLLLVAIAYGLSPVDLIPDPLLGFGQIDDILALASAGYIAYRQWRKFSSVSPAPAEET